jgi:hypothetical protein
MKPEFEISIKTIYDRLITIIRNEIDTLDICSVSSHDDHDTYKSIIGEIKYKLISNDKQFGKMVHVFKNINIEDYDWFIKIRPDINLLEDINIEKILSCNKDAMNTRLRWYNGPHLFILYGTSHSVKKNDVWEQSWIYNVDEQNITPDDQIYIFNKNIINIFDPIDFNNIDINLVDTYYRYNHNYPVDNRWQKYIHNVKDMLIN